VTPVPFIGQRQRPIWTPPGLWFPRRRPIVVWPPVFAKPTNLRLESQSETTARLIWDDNSSNETGFEIERALGQGAFANITTTAANETTFSDSGLVAGTQYRYRVRAVRVGSTPTLSTDNVAFWKLEETSGTRVDEVGSNDLADNNTVTGATGIVGQAAQFVRANSEQLTIDDNSDLSAGDVDFTISCWAFLDTNANNMQILSKWQSTADQREYNINYNTGTDRIRTTMTPDGTAGAAVVVSGDNFGAPPTSTWIFIVVWHDATANTINIQINNGTVNSTAHTTGVFDSTARFSIGALDTDGAHWDGRVDAVGFWRRVLLSAEKTELYDLGSGLEHPYNVTSTTTDYTNIATLVTHTIFPSTHAFTRELALPRFDDPRQSPLDLTDPSRARPGR